MNAKLLYERLRFIHFVVRHRSLKTAFFLIILWCLFCSSAFGQENVGENVNEYVISFPSENRNIAMVSAKLKLKDSVIKMAAWGHPWLPNGWATFVTNLKVQSAKGKPIEYSIIEKEGWGSWRVDGKDGTALSISYQVNFNHHEYDWNPAGGIDSRPEVTDTAHFLVTKALFIYSPGTEASSVQFEIPENWKIATNWDQVTPKKYYVDSWINLVNNSLVLGDFYKQKISNGPMDLIIAVESKLENHYEWFVDILQKQLNEFSRIFQGTPDRNYLVSIRSADEDDGESFHDSFNQVVTSDGIERRLIVWANTMAHEMFHYWNGANFLVGDNLNDLYWFSEGFTEYYASLSLLRTGVIDKETYFRKVEHYLTRYFISKKMWPEKPVSLVHAGDEKGKNWLFLYGGGATMALFFDIEIRRLTKGQKSLDDVMFLLKEKYGLKNKKINNSHVLEALNEVAGTDFTKEFEQFVEGTESYLNLKDVFFNAGLYLDSFSDEMFISEINEENNSIFRQMISN
ncbi:MAG: hypothetical protein AAF090_08210 [Bacteroidota bacterium]